MTEREINRCLTIHRILLHCAEEVAYPCMIHLVNIFLVAENQLDQSWPQAVQDYLSEQLTSGSYVTYQEVILLWSTLFPEAKDMEKLVFLIGAHLSSWGSSVQRFALRFLAMLGHYQRVLQSMRDLRTQQDQPMPLLSRIECAMQVLLALQFQQVLRAEQDQQVLLILRDSDDDQTLLVILALRAMRAFRNRRMLLDLARLFLTHESAEKALEGLSLGALAAGADPAETIDRLLILLGRTLWIREADEKGDTILQELQQIARTVCSSLAPDDNGESEIRLNIVRSLPARSADEIALVVQHAEETTDERIQKACAHTLRYSAPQTPEAWKKLEVATQSTVKSIGTAAKGCLQRKG